MNISVSMNENEKILDAQFTDCADILKREMNLGEQSSRKAVLYYVETAADNMTLQDSVIGRMITCLWEMPSEEQTAYLRENALGVTDAKLLKTTEEAADGVLAGDVILLIDGLDSAVKIKAAGFPGMGVNQAVNETVIRGSNEGFTESVKSSTALVRKRIRNTDLKVQEVTVGKETKTTVAVLYMESLVRPQVLADVKERLSELTPEKNREDSPEDEENSGENRKDPSEDERNSRENNEESLEDERNSEENREESLENEKNSEENRKEANDRVRLQKTGEPRKNNENSSESKKRKQAAARVGVLDSGIIEQLTEQFPLSPFPQYQTTERPDRAAIALLQGKILILSDNSPVGLLLPANFASFFHTSDDYYSRTAVVALERILRFLAAFLAVGLPGLYLSVITYHQEILPTAFLFRLAEARAGIPVPALVEVLMMELAFELLREAGVRVPGAMGNAIGIVGGLIVGDGAVSAGLVSPIIVIVVALTALASFAIPNEEMASAFRVLKYVLIVLAALFGLYGWFLGLFLILVHLSKLGSYHFPYLYPIVSAELNGDADQKDLWIRFPLRWLVRKSFYSQKSVHRR
ncbi:MAG: spore germination protein [Lachnospiraceae bacterium]|nr:spore germination protein [Lachnospiraceae bacterium]